ncbi:MAG: hypothetical protein HY931_04255 [Candidatus Falkowbacteria bacterium]|nr:MAG: hypothetical protein HY931_04255 [Candidatus Falkowbacteria bacterium]
MNKFSNPTRVAEAALAIIFAPKTNPDKKSDWKWRHELIIHKAEANLMEYYDSQTVVSYELYGISVGVKKLEPKRFKAYSGVIELIQENIFGERSEFPINEEKINQENKNKIEKFSHLIKVVEFASNESSPFFRDSRRVETFRLSPAQREKIVFWEKW